MRGNCRETEKEMDRCKAPVWLCAYPSSSHFAHQENVAGWLVAKPRPEKLCGTAACCPLIVYLAGVGVYLEPGSARGRGPPRLGEAGQEADLTAED